MSPDEIKKIKRGILKIRTLQIIAHIPVAILITITLLRILVPPVNNFLKQNATLLETWNAFTTIAIFMFIVGGFILQNTKCPLCNNLFFVKKTWYGFSRKEFTSECIHCGLKIKSGNIEQSEL